MEILKFGGRSLANGEGLSSVIDLIQQKKSNGKQSFLVVSARGDSTDLLLKILDKAKKQKEYLGLLKSFEAYQLLPAPEADIASDLTMLENLFKGVALLGEYNDKIKDQVLSYGEILSAKIIVHLLNTKGVDAQFVNAKDLIVTNKKYGAALPFHDVSKEKVLQFFAKFPKDTVPVITGFIASDLDGQTTTLGRNGSNYTATLLANYLEADIVENYTHVDGLYTANPDIVRNAKKIDEISYQDANEVANFGANIIHAKTIIPLIEKNIPLKILNTFNKESTGTLISSKHTGDGIKTINVIQDVTLVNLEGRGLLDRVGVDARIFGTLSKADISVSIISQGSSERGIGFIVKDKDALKAKEVLDQEFASDYNSKDISSISLKSDISVISVIGQDLLNFGISYNALIKNNITPLLINNTLSGKNVCIVVNNQDHIKAINVIHGEIFGIYKRINLFIFGKGLVGKALIKQLVSSRQSILARKNIKLNVVGIANSQRALLNEEGIDENWETAFTKQSQAYQLSDIIAFANENHLENLIAIDVTANKEFVVNYIDLIAKGFNLISANKIANTISYDFYNQLRRELDKYGKSYLYETNVGAGLPLINTIQQLHVSGERINKIRGVFSGTLSYLFNSYSDRDVPFSEILKEAIQKGLTEPDPREDLSGNDVARKLLILARELDSQKEFSDVEVNSLIPEEIIELEALSVADFKNNLEKFDQVYQRIKSDQQPDHVLRYVGDLDVESDSLEVKLVSVPRKSPLGQVSGSDSIFEIYTESYGDHPLVIQGAGAGAEVTARGVFGDILRLVERF